MFRRLTWLEAALLAAHAGFLAMLAVTSAGVAENTGAGANLAAPVYGVVAGVITALTIAIALGFRTNPVLSASAALIALALLLYGLWAS